MAARAAESAFASFEEKWLRANPEQAMVAVFLPPPERRLAAAFGSLVYELEQTLFGVREPQVAAAKLEWWRHELAGVSAGASRHPVARALLEAGPPLLPAPWADLASGALALLDAPPPASLDAAFARFADFYGPVAAVESTLFAGGTDIAPGHVDLWTSSHLLAAAAQPELLSARGEAVPLDLFARHGITRADLARPGTAQSALLADFVRGLGTRIGHALERAGPASLGRRVRARLDLAAANDASRRSDPAGFLARSAPSRWRLLQLVWREARARASNTPPA